MTSTSADRPGLAWSWPACARGLLYALPAVVAGWDDPARGIALAVGVLPAAAVGMPPRRKARLSIVVFGVCVGAPMVLGALLAPTGWAAVAAVFVLAVAAALLAAGRRAGVLAMSLCLPMVGVGLSFAEVGDALRAAGLILAGSLYACLLSMAWPQQPVNPDAQRAPPPLRGRREALHYGLRLGAAGAIAAAAGLAWAPTHPGWPVAAALLVMRPGVQAQRTRSLGRVLAVLAGSATAIVLLAVAPPPWVYALVAGAVIALAAGTQGSRWYVLPAFSTVLVLLLLQIGPGQESDSVTVPERIAATLVGVALAWLFGILPERRARSGPPGAEGQTRPGLN
uniref:FUSC family protein n=1 Tax=Streptomyces sp. NBC_00049 TaxID=2903617 RepID=A0AAU2JYU7_9ACTN